MAELTGIKAIREFLTSPFAQIRPRYILGGGSNILFTADYDGLILRPVIKGIEMTGENTDHLLIRAGAGEDWDSLVSWCVSKNIGGIENLSLIPGTVGASPVQNIGAYGVEIRDVIHAVEAIRLDDGEMIMLTGEDCRFGYRDSVFKNELRNKVIITSVTYKFNKKYALRTGYAELERELNKYPEVSIKTIREAVIAIRRNKLPDPDEIGNAGSFFKNPVVKADQISALCKAYPDLPVYQDDTGKVKLSAAWLIDQCGWKGVREGNTGTYKKQPLILVNHGSATGSEILDFARRIQKSVMDRFAIRLDIEVNVVGD